MFPAQENINPLITGDFTWHIVSDSTGTEGRAVSIAGCGRRAAKSDGRGLPDGTVSVHKLSGHLDAGAQGSHTYSQRVYRWVRDYKRRLRLYAGGYHWTRMRLPYCLVIDRALTVTSSFFFSKNTWMDERNILVWTFTVFQTFMFWIFVNI